MVCEKKEGCQRREGCELGKVVLEGKEGRIGRVWKGRMGRVWKGDGGMEKRRGCGVVLCCVLEGKEPETDSY